MRKHIFNAGPSVLPLEVLKEASNGILEINGKGQSILEISHRGNFFEGVIQEAKSLLRELLGWSDAYEVLFLQGGASMQFCMIPMNFLNENETAAYVDTGTWSSKAIKEAQFFGNVNVLATSKDKKYNFIPKNYEVPKQAKYLHITTNNTIYGTQYHSYPETNALLFADMSSDILSKEIPADKFDLIYAGAQKNLGPAGVTIAILKKDLLGTIDKTVPSMLDYRVYSENDSLYNTPNVFGIYVCLLTLRWLKKNGGLKTMESLNNKKATAIYNVIDQFPFFKGHAVKEDRSKMNITFTLSRPEMEKDLISACEKEGIIGIAGHRSVGGFRASVYNALPLESVVVLAQVMTDFAQKHS